MIKEFKGEYSWLSNFAPVEIRYRQRIFPSVEHAYMSEKNDSEEWKDFCADSGNSASLVKKESRKIELIKNWDIYKLRVMHFCLDEKFSKEPFKSKLLSTGNQNIQEGNYWGDKYWGICLKTGEGENHLGRMIMKIRERLLKEKYKLKLEENE